MTLSYLVSTAGHAQQQNELYPHEIQTILQLIEDGADELRSEKVVGFTSKHESSQGWRCDRYSFPELLDLSTRLASGLIDRGVLINHDDTRIVSLLCPTGLDFLLAWIALMRMGYGVVLIAPQCSPSAVLHLYQASSSTQMIYHSKYSELVQSARQSDTSLSTTGLPSITSLPSPTPTFTLPCKVKDVNSVSHVFHTSGTSGTPKPIPNTHVRSVSVLPRRSLPTYLSSTSTSPTTDHDYPPESAAFTTTPLFHGGISDLLRAWMARSMIYFYPTSDVAITSENVVSAVSACQSPVPPLDGISLTPAQEEERQKRFQVTSFLSVPYILSTLAEDPDGEGLKMLRSMEYVSTGGAPLDSRIGDMMVEKGVRLVSRLGSSECGFLLSSHRIYETEKDWELLRNDSPYSDALVFEPVNDSKERYEMVVTDSWTSKTKSNRDDGSYATGDLYQPHPSKKNVWKYVGRGDDVIVLSNGEKASPGPIETFLRSSEHLSDALVVGSDQSQLGVLLFPKHYPPPSDLLYQLAPLIAQANDNSPSFAQISQEMCLIVQDQSKALPKSSKGTIQRGVAYDVFKVEISKLYYSQHGEVDSILKRSVEEIGSEVKRIIESIAATRLKVDNLDENTDLFSWGVDSLMATRIRTALQKTLNTGEITLPNNVVFEKPSIKRLSQYIFDLQEHKGSRDDNVQDTYKLMEDLVEKYSRFEATANGNAVAQKQGKTVLLTGGTGSLGSFLIDELNQTLSGTIAKIICLVRGEDDESAYQRVEDGLRKRGISMGKKVEVMVARLSAKDLGLQADVYKRLKDEVDVIIHAAWPVHFTSSLVSFEDSIKGTRHLLDLLAGTNQGKLYYCSSLASVLNQNTSVILEQPSEDPSTASPIGYSQSKWVTEGICRAAAGSSSLKDRVHILRVGQLCGDTKLSHWNEKEGWPLMIRTAQTTGTLPMLEEKPSWLPVDLAARAITDIVTAQNPDQPFMYHIAHPKYVEWKTILDGLEAAELSFKRLSPQEWLKKVEATSDDVEDNPSKQMLHMWKAAYGDPAKVHSEVMVDTTNACNSSRTMSSLPAIDEEQVGKMVQAWRKSGFL
ncbi:hypothetical protein I302_105582 [Kwoniella bestiolae CBS 10118]|uniref:Carrier domain-containing protein n=1 Tax=Kwoniella bestiolae CBS 10118 TaxID=1296100 RepID=A0A1B9G1K5_9TREE|nr:hypothetical protein I302_04701 [Kwoniella bestiolae CBS 10118]OCF24891.1 hypothetical protein I302_04701 [Kwoniella bestiolae CBS 10118]